MSTWRVNFCLFDVYKDSSTIRKLSEAGLIGHEIKIFIVLPMLWFAQVDLIEVELIRGWLFFVVTVVLRRRVELYGIGRVNNILHR